jgi:hypothetical protein
LQEKFSGLFHEDCRKPVILFSIDQEYTRLAEFLTLCGERRVQMVERTAWSYGLCLCRPRRTIKCNNFTKNDNNSNNNNNNDIMVVRGRKCLLRSETMSRGANAQVNDYNSFRGSYHRLLLELTRPLWPRLCPLESPTLDCHKFPNPQRIDIGAGHDTPSIGGALQLMFVT